VTAGERESKYRYMREVWYPRRRREAIAAGLAVKVDDLDGETWKAVGDEGRYAVSDFGRVKRLTREVPCGNGHGTTSTRIRRERLLRQRPDKDGYLRVGIYQGGKHCSRAVHRLVLEAFVGPRPFVGAESRHLDGDEANCRLDNLRWGTHAENVADRFLHGTVLRGEKIPSSKLNWQAVAVIRHFRGKVSAALLARLHGVLPLAVYSIYYGKTWTGVPYTGWRRRAQSGTSL